MSASVKKMPSQREAVILASLLHGERYGRDIRSEYERRTKQSLPLGSLYVTLDRLEEKGFIRSRLGESASERGGNRRKYFKITAAGVGALNEARQWAAAVSGAPTHA